MEAAEEERLDLIGEQLKSGRFSAPADHGNRRKIKKMTIAEIQQEIMRMKKEQDICILVHAYQGTGDTGVADYMGDSTGLSVQASKSDCKGIVIMCGVRFMAEACKVLSPDKKGMAGESFQPGCPMAEQLDREGLRELKQSIRIMRLWLIFEL